MATRDSEASTVVDTPADREGAEGSQRERAPRVVEGAGGTPFALYKPGQGKYVRWGTAIGAGLITVAAAAFAYEKLSVLTFISDDKTLLITRVAVSTALLAGLSWLTFRLVGQKPRVVDFLIATEGEMKKVNWASRKEVIGATKIVIVTVLLLGFLLFVVDLLFILFFNKIGVIRMPILKSFLGGGE